MNWLAQFASFLFPLRTHLIDEIEYLRGQVAQKQRRIDELQDALAEIAKPAPKVQFERKPDGKLVPVQPRGWDAWRAAKRAEPKEEEANGTEQA